MVKNQIVQQNEQQNTQQNEDEKITFSATINQQKYQRAILNALRDKNAVKRFTASIVSAVTTTPSLQECEPTSIVSAGLLGESLNLSPSPQLGHYYFIPFKQKARKDKNGKIIPECTKATFVLGYKGYIQLATRSGQYRKINVVPIKKGELISFNPLEEEIEAEIIQDENERENTPTMGYYAMFEYINGFRKAMYWSKEKMLSYADRYSATFSLYATGGMYPKVSYADYEAGKYSPKDEWKYSSFWYKDFDGMACKTMLRQLIGKWGIMSIEMQRAYEVDMGVISENGNVDYVDNPTENVIEPPENPEKTVSAPKQLEPPPPEIPSVPENVHDTADEFTMIMEGFKV